MGLFSLLFSEVEPSEVRGLRRTSVIFYISVISLIILSASFLSFTSLIPSFALKIVVVTALFFVLFIASVSDRNLSTPWLTVGGLLTLFGFSATITLLVFYERAEALSVLFRLLGLSLGFYSVLRLCSRYTVVSYAVFLLFFFSAAAAAVATVGDAIAHPGGTGSFPFSNPNHAGCVYAAASAAGVALLLAQPRFGTTTRYSTLKIIPMIIVISICFLGLIATRSRGAFLALIISIPPALAVRFTDRPAFLSFITVPVFGILLWMVVAPFSFWSSSAGLRLMLWKDAFRIGVAHLPQGCSPCRFFAVLPQSISEQTISHPLMGSVTLSAHSLYLDVFASCGLLIFPFILCIVLLLFCLYRRAKQEGEEDDRRSLYASLYLPVLCVFLLHGVFDSAVSSFEVGCVAVILSAAASALIVTKRPPLMRRERTIGRIIRITVILIAVYLFGAMFYIFGVGELKRARTLFHLDKAAASGDFRRVNTSVDEILRYGYRDYYTAVALHKAANLAHKEGLTNTALSLFGRLLSIAPDFGSARYELFRLYNLNGEEKKALEQLRRYLKSAVISPANWRFLANLGDFLLSKGETEFAVEVKERARRLHSRYERMYNR